VRTCDILLYAGDFTYSRFVGKVTRHERRCTFSRNGGCDQVPTWIWITSRDSPASSGHLKRILTRPSRWPNEHLCLSLPGPSPSMTSAQVLHRSRQLLFKKGLPQRKSFAICPMNTIHYYKIHRTARCCTARLKSCENETAADLPWYSFNNGSLTVSLFQRRYGVNC
jgi:hypothetical protein